jgi:X-Pro dipeptidyl-peptidase
VTKGILDGLNISTLTQSTPLVPGVKYAVDLPLLPEDYVFDAGHQIGVILLGSYSGYTSRAKQNRANITVHFDRSRIQLPIVGGRQAAETAGL